MSKNLILAKACFITAVCLFPIMFMSSCFNLNSSNNKFTNSKWTIIGPYDETSQNSCPLFYGDQLAELGGETVISESGLPDGIKNSIQITARKGIIDFTRVYPNKNWSVAYAYMEFEGNGEECFFRIGSDDGLRIWINGTMVVDDHTHRALDINSNSFRVALKNGTNRMLVKVCQGEEDWAFSLRDTTLEEHEAFLSDSSGIALSISSQSHFFEDKETLAFSVLANHAPLSNIPISYSASDSNGNVIATGKSSLGESIAISLPSNIVEYISIKAELELVGDSIAQGKFLQHSVEKSLFKGNPETVLSAYSSRARKAATELTTSSRWSAIYSDEQSSIKDIAPTLLYLADIIDGKQNNVMVSEDKQILAVTFVNDILNAMKKRPQALSHLTGYRQMAYQSDIDGSLQPYSLYLPESYSPDKAYSLVVMLHGYNENDYDYGTILASLMPEDFIIVSVFGRGDLYYQSAGEQDVLDVTDRIIEGYSIDKNRVYLMGNSMGGLGTWRIGALYPDRFAAIAPYCGWTGQELLDNLGNMKTYVVHGNADQTVAINFDRNSVKKLETLGYDVSFVEIEKGSHSAWTEWTRIYPPNTILDIFRSAVRNPSPANLIATIPQVRYGKHYWITVNELDTSGVLMWPEYTAKSPYDSFYQPHPAPGRFEAKRRDDGSIAVVTERINALSIDIDTVEMHGTKVEKINIDGTIVKVPAGATTLHLKKHKDSSWQIDSAHGSKTLPPHDGGGIADLFTKPLIIVYGTQDMEKAAVLEAAARSLADWSPTNVFDIGMKTGMFTVMADTELTSEDISANNIILLGTPEENSISARISNSLEPYYTNGNIVVDGTSYMENGLCITMPNPQASGKIIGYIDCSKCLTSVNAAKQYFFEFQFRLRFGFGSELMGYPTFLPDVFVMTSNPLRDEWSGWFDCNWENLQGRAAK